LGEPILNKYDYQKTTKILFSGCPPFGEGEIQELFQDFQGPFSVNSRT
jgi:hypothetical protein